MTGFYTKSTSDSARATAEAVQALLDNARASERRDAQMLFWTVAGVVCAGIAAIASLVAILIVVL